jgi:phosphomevalonate kinase
MIKVSVPGKLYIAGEYAVVTPGHPAILVAVNKFITVTIEKSNQGGSIDSSHYQHEPIKWIRAGEQIILDQNIFGLRYILAAINLVEELAIEQRKLLDYFHLTVKSELNNDDGKKYGLGSSGAITVATITALAQLYDLPVTQEEIFKLAVLAHLKIGVVGSFGDLAASTFTGWIAFTTCDRLWVQEQSKHHSIGSMIQKTWPHLSIESLVLPKALKLVVGWTGTPASTNQLVKAVRTRHKQKFHHQFLKESRLCVEQLILAFKSNDIALIQDQIRLNRKLLLKMSANTQIMIETPALTKLCNLAEGFGGAAKSSGAGGGDCGIALFQEQVDLSQIDLTWKKAGIVLLPLKVYQRENGGHNG